MNEAFNIALTIIAVVAMVGLYLLFLVRRAIRRVERYAEPSDELGELCPYYHSHRTDVCTETKENLNGSSSA